MADFGQKTDLDRAAGDLNNDTPLKYQKPKSIIDAISDIQQYHVFEKEQQEDINSNFFTLKQVADFFKVGARSGFYEALMFIFLLPLLQTIYPTVELFFFHHQIGTYERLLMILLSYSSLIVMTIWLTFLVRLYEGSMTKKAILSLLMGRSMAFTIKGIIIYVGALFLYLYIIKHPTSIYDFIVFVLHWFNVFFHPKYIYGAMDIYKYFYIFIVPKIHSLAYEALISMSLFAVIPFLFVSLKGLYKRLRKQNNDKLYEDY